MGEGYKRSANASHPLSFDFTWDFDRVYSWQFGREVNIRWYGDRPDNYAPWNEAKVVLFYPSIFDLRSPAAGPGNKSTVVMQHFVSYVRGANGLDGVAP